MVRQGLILADPPNPSAARHQENAALLQIRVDELARHGVTDIRVIGTQPNDYPDLTVRPGASVQFQPDFPTAALGSQLACSQAGQDDAFFLLAGPRHFDINLLDLALAITEGASGAVAVEAGATPTFCGVAVLTPRETAKLFQPAPDTLLSRLDAATKAGTIPTRAYNRPYLTGVTPLPRRGAVIFDRDGVLNVDVEYAHRPDQIIWIDGAKAAVKAVNDAGLFAFVATNQSGVARGYFAESDVLALHAWMNIELAKVGAHIDEFQYAPHHADGVIPDYSKDSDLRKPAPGMIRLLIAKWDCWTEHVVMIGDKDSDLQSATAAGIRGWLFTQGDLNDAVGQILLSITTNSAGEN